jgi:hypothetical protein
VFEGGSDGRAKADIPMVTARQSAMDNLPFIAITSRLQAINFKCFRDLSSWATRDFKCPLTGTLFHGREEISAEC